MAGEQDQENHAPKGAGLVDESLLDAALALSPVERLRLNDRMIRSVALLREGVGKTDESDRDRR
jgi:hypothetical protein